MAVRDPLVIINGQTQQLPSGDTINGAGVVDGGAVTIHYTFDDATTGGDPGNGVLRLSNATQAVSIAAYLDDLDALGENWEGALLSLDDSTNPIKAFMRLVNANDPTKWILFAITAITDQSGYVELTIGGQDQSDASPFIDGDTLVAAFTQCGNVGQGVPAGGSTGEVLTKASGADYDTEWAPAAGGGTTFDVQVFAASGTWTKPANAVTVHVSLIGGGGGGGSGRRGASSTTRGGGGGGGGGGYSYDSFAASALDATEAVTIGAGGAGGGGQTTNDSNGVGGSAGGNSEFDTIAGSLVANGGSGGGAGSTSSGTGGAGGTGAGSVTETGGAGGTAADGGSPTNKRAGAGGGAGAGLNSSNGYIGNGKGGSSGGAGGAIGQTVFNAVTGSMAGFQGNTGFTGATVIAVTKLELAGGGGGGGGNTSTSSNGIMSGFGGDGGNFGGGGGGNAATLNNTGATSLGGGTGGSGLCVVVTECST